MKTGFKIEVFSQKNCSGCQQVKQLLNVRGLVYRELLIDALEENKKELFSRVPNVRSVPQVFIDNRHIGGLEDLIKELNSNDYY